MSRSGRNEFNRLSSEQASGAAVKPCSSSFDNASQVKSEIEAWMRHAAASNGFGDAGVIAWDQSGDFTDRPPTIHS
jgi:hypothetical protein